ncbi:protein SYM1-like isoform X1 [Varroa jacobsoni]|uniref:protein SYM1-like isoform X1 n=1 Tax=Varroa jacobsoni TaxID=62625 RepID=UPI000BF5F1BD|nr:protein SYM1-like isoform X1 [Varroa jacobsoni]XP_022692022.1 protein SYM1-like isoform X1 [Varroa jacobsoni]
MLKLNPVRFYNLLNIKHPTATQVLTTAALMATGDVLSQKFVEKREHINVQRTGRFFFVGCVYVGPVLRTWYPRLEQLISHSAKMRALKMASIDQLVFTPVFLPGFLITLSTFQGKNIDGICETVRTDTVPILLTNWMIWPAAQVINFNFVPLQFRVQFASTIALFWNIYLAWKANQDLAPISGDAAAKEPIESQ